MTGEVTDAFRRPLAQLVRMAMNPPDATFTNGRYELPAHARGVLVLADPPEAGWRIEPVSKERPAVEADLPATRQASS